MENNQQYEQALNQDQIYQELDMPERPESGKQNGELWKKFGRGNDVGNMLFSMYSAKEKPKISYPTLKTKKKPTPAEELKMGGAKGPCPQQTQIEYPELPRKKYKFHAVDFIPKRRHEEEISAQMEKDKRKPAVAYGKRGVDRNRMIEELQEINRFGDKKHLEAALQKEKEMRAAYAEAAPQVDNRARLARKYNTQMAQNAMKHYEEKYGQNPAAFLLAQPKTMDAVRSKQDNELQDLFDQIIIEIEDRQSFLEDMTKEAPNPAVEARMKKEIVERVAELQKIKELQVKNQQ